MAIELLAIKDIRRDGGTQGRTETDHFTVSEYAELMEETVGKNPFPPVRVVYDGNLYWLWDGFHRVEAAESVGWTEIDAEIRPGTRRDAVLLSCSANKDHGLRRTNADKTRAVVTLLGDDEWRRWSDREIARRCGVSNTFVGMIRKFSPSSDDSEPRTYTTKHGTQSTMTIPARPVAEQAQTEPSEKEERIKITFSNGMGYCTMAIIQLEKIHPKDLEREQALDRMQAWLDEHRNPVRGGAR